MTYNNLEHVSLLRAFKSAPTLPVPEARRFFSVPLASLSSPLDVQLLPCNRPIGSLETAPRTSLRADSPQETWEGFWCVADEGYYTRCTYTDGRECWFRLADAAPRDEHYERSRARIIKFSSSSAHDDVVTMRLMAAHGRRPILVGKSRRRVRPAVATH